MDEFPRRCPWSHIQLSEKTVCRPNDCRSCGWYPAVARERQRRIDQYSNAGKLHLWGKPEGDVWEKEHGS